MREKRLELTRNYIYW